MSLPEQEDAELDEARYAAIRVLRRGAALADGYEDFQDASVLELFGVKSFTDLKRLMKLSFLSGPHSESMAALQSALGLRGGHWDTLTERRASYAKATGHGVRTLQRFEEDAIPTLVDYMARLTDPLDLSNELLKSAILLEWAVDRLPDDKYNVKALNLAKDIIEAWWCPYSIHALDSRRARLADPSRWREGLL